MNKMKTRWLTSLPLFAACCLPGIPVRAQSRTNSQARSLDFAGYR